MQSKVSNETRARCPDSKSTNMSGKFQPNPRNPCLEIDHLDLSNDVNYVNYHHVFLTLNDLLSGTQHVNI